MGIEAYPPVNSVASSYLTASAYQWTDFTPIWTVTGTAPTNYTITGRFLKVGALCHMRIHIQMGASFTHGSSTVWFVQTAAPCPVPANMSGLGVVYYYDNTASANAGIARCGAGSTAWTLLTASAATPAYNVPFTWAASDHLTVSASYEVTP
jgi:hypothetical protein